MLPYWHTIIPPYCHALSQRSLPYSTAFAPLRCGATTFRTQKCAELLRCRPVVVRGNGSEVLALAGRAGGGRGVDSTAASHEALEAAKQLARDNGCVVGVSGAVDVVTDGQRVVRVANGVALLQQARHLFSGTALSVVYRLSCKGMGYVRKRYIIVLGEFVTGSLNVEALI